MSPEDDETLELELPETTPEPVDEAAQLADLEARAAAAKAARTAIKAREPAALGQGRPPAAKTVSRPSWCALGCGAPVARTATYCAACIPRAAQDRLRARLLDAYASLPAAYRWCPLEGPQLEQFVGELPARKARRALDAQRVLLTGPSGAGKSTVAAVMLRAILDRALAPGARPEVVDAAESARFVVSFDVAYCRADTELGREPSLLLAWKRARVLVLDDLGAEPRVHSSAVGELIHYRESFGLRTIVTTGFSQKYIEMHYGAGIYRRLTDNAVVIALPERKR